MAERRIREELTPWEFPVEGRDLIEVDLAHIVKKKAEMPKANLGRMEEKQKVVVSPVRVQLKKELHKETKTEDKQQPIKQVQKSQPRELPKIQHKKLQIFLKTVPKSDFIIRIPEDPFHIPPKINFDKHIIKHMIKKHTNSTNHLKSQTKDSLHDILEHDPLTLSKRRNGSLDALHFPQHNAGHQESKRKMSDYEQQIIKKCALKNFQIYEESREPGPSKEVKQRKHRTVDSKKHILDRILSRLE